MTQAAALFVTSFLDPLIETYTFCKDRVREQGVIQITCNSIQGVGRAVREHPLDAVCLVTGFLGNVEVLLPVVHLVNRVKAAQLMKRMFISDRSSSLAARLVTVTSYGMVAYFVLSPSVAAALEYNSLADAKKAYPGGPCPSDPWQNLMHPAAECVRQTESLHECQSVIPSQTHNDLYVFTRHLSTQVTMDPVSIINFAKNMTCFYTSLNETSGVAKTCFPDLNRLDIRTIEQVEGMTLSKAHEGLQPGESVIHIGMQLENQGCGFFSPTVAKTDLEHGVCLLTSLKPGDSVSQMCFDPQHPESITLKKIEGIELNHPTEGPVSVLIKDPKAFGLRVEPDRPDCAPDCTLANRLSFWDALLLWWNQEPSCESSKAKEKSDP